MELKIHTEDTLKTLIERGKRTGSLTYEEVNAAVPAGVHDPDRLHEILELLESNGINVIDEDEESGDAVGAPVQHARREHCRHPRGGEAQPLLLDALLDLPQRVSPLGREGGAEAVVDVQVELAAAN